VVPEPVRSLNTADLVAATTDGGRSWLPASTSRRARGPSGESASYRGKPCSDRARRDAMRCGGRPSNCAGKLGPQRSHGPTARRLAVGLARLRSYARSCQSRIIFRHLAESLARRAPETLPARTFLPRAPRRVRNVPADRGPGTMYAKRCAAPSLSRVDEELNAVVSGARRDRIRRRAATTSSSRPSIPCCWSLNPAPGCASAVVGEPGFNGPREAGGQRIRDGDESSLLVRRERQRSRGRGSPAL
jgi:hypothetical protein